MPSAPICLSASMKILDHCSLDVTQNLILTNLNPMYPCNPIFVIHGKQTNILPEGLQALQPHFGLNSHAYYKLSKNCIKCMQHTSLRRWDTFDDQLHSFYESWYLWIKRTEANGPKFSYSCDLFIWFNSCKYNQIHGQIYCYNFYPLKETFNSQDCIASG